MKAARFEWVVFANINTPPPSRQWLNELAASTDDSSYLLLGYVHHKTGNLRLQSFDSIDSARPFISKTERSKGNGHQGKWFRYIRGKYDFVAVRKADGHETLKLFEQDIRHGRLFARRLHIFLHNLFH